MRAEAEGAHGTRWARVEGWQGILLIAATYVYFLIFAQFGFLKRLAELGIAESVLPHVMAAMAMGGIGMSLVAPRVSLWMDARVRLQTALSGCGLAAVCSLLHMNSAIAITVGLMVGLSLGLLTVTLVANLPLWIGFRQPLLKTALGTGIGYLACNFPPLFNASPASIALSAAGCCVVAAIVLNRSPHLESTPSPLRNVSPSHPTPFVLTLMWFTALVWFDSAAFYIIQNSPALKAGTWQGDLHLWRTGLLHLAAALLGAFLLARRGIAATLILSLSALAAACLLLSRPEQVSSAALLYPVGVSLYSVALVAYPSFLMPTVSQAMRARRAGYLYALAGWVGSALGIGMAQHLHHVPKAFVFAAVALFVVPWLWIGVRWFGRTAQLMAVSVIALTGVAALLEFILHPPVRPLAHTIALTSTERGRRVYIAEGCINCHSQYVRPNTADVLMWGPVTDIETIRRQEPPLIGNRRQGPDLSQVGARRSPLWLRMHFMNPRDVSYNSVMPRFDYLFHDARGDDLVAYMASLNSPGHWTDAVAKWQPSKSAASAASADEGSRLYSEHCATCHTQEGQARRKWASSFHRPPPNLLRDPWQHVPLHAPGAQLQTEIARIAKFGLQDTDMPGHEYLPDEQLVSIAHYVASQRAAKPR